MSPTRNTNVWSSESETHHAIPDPGPGAKLKSTSSMKRGPWPTATHQKVQAPSTKLQAASAKQQAKKYY